MDETDKSILALSGDLTVLHAHEIKKQIEDTLNISNGLILDLSDAKDIDITFLQILCAAHKSAVNNNKSIEIDKDSFRLIEKSLYRTGFIRQMGCLRENKNDCLFKE